MHRCHLMLRPSIWWRSAPSAHFVQCRIGLLAAVAAIGLLAACSSGTGSLQPGAASPGNAFGNLLAFGTTNPGPTPAKPTDVIKIDCPEIEVLDGAAALRVGGQDNASVRYQFSMGDVARECIVENGQINIKVGVEGRVLLGPAGGPGGFQVPVRIAVRREIDQKAALSKIYRIAASIPAGETQTSFSMVSEPLQVPYLRPRANDDYTIVVGFDQNADKPVQQAKKKRR